MTTKPATTAAAGRAQEAAESPPEVIHHADANVFDMPVRIGQPWLRIIVTIGLTIAVAIALASYLGVNSKYLPVASGTGALLGIGVLALQARYYDRSLRKQYADISEAAAFEGLQKHLKRFGVYGILYSGRDNGVTQAVRGLANAGCAGRVYRLTDALEELAAIPEPLDAPFEPTPLSEKTDSFNELRGGKASASERIRSSVKIFMNIYGRHKWFKGFVGVCLVIGVIALPIQAFFAIRRLIAGQVPVELMVIGMVVLVAMIAVAARGRRPRMWFLVPGGLLVLESAWNRDGWTYSLLPRDESVLLLLENQRMLGAARQGGFAGWRVVSEREMEMILRAWRCPHPPPDDRQLAAFAENA